MIEDRKINWIEIFVDVIQKQLNGMEQKIPIFISCYLVHLYKCKGLLTKEEDMEYTILVEVVELGNPDQVHVEHSEEDKEHNGATEVVGLAT
jgi:hypothetical protein